MEKGIHRDGCASPQRDGARPWPFSEAEVFQIKERDYEVETMGDLSALNRS